MYPRGVDDVTRDRFALEAMAQLLQSEGRTADDMTPEGAEAIARAAYMIADAMLAERARRAPSVAPPASSPRAVAGRRDGSAG